MSTNTGSDTRHRDLPIGSVRSIHSTSGVKTATLHLDRNTPIPASDTTCHTSVEATPETILCTFDVPAYMSIPDFLSYVAPISDSVAHYRIVRDASPDKYMVLMKFRDSKPAHDYYQQFNGRSYSSMEPEKCQIVYIESFSINSVYIPPYTFPFLDDPAKHPISLSSATQNDSHAWSTCPVCLEKMDEKVTSLLTILCQHTFHCHCLSKWGDGSCPVCRYSRNPNTDKNDPSAINGPSLPCHDSPSCNDDPYHSQDGNQCLECNATESLWFCLICGHIGCGRQQHGHAYDHYRETSHLYSLEIETQRVWDYAGDGYVHRLIQNMVDGKLVELPAAGDQSNEETGYSGASEDKLNAISDEYNYLLSSQLDSQRLFYEDQLEEITAQLSSLTCEKNSLTTLMHTLGRKNDKLRQESETFENELQVKQKFKKEAEQKLENWRTKLEKINGDFLEEKKLTASLLSTNDGLKTKIDEQKNMIKELGDQVRDLMFFLEARDTVQGNPEMEGGSVQMQQSKSSRRRGGRERR
ncbi:BRCA1-associated protein 2-domain-containing protein [Radiomyces spectabilis]|uniref:BRCA1-associated protein 2-domain-containing protein n=1 Tax=Radiomyces spectabilis TaxID=64574 RepID=UPI00221FD870|nr:BRCA1-associated protein 2-domain-containing protein [Radiomyces spectabilis]KAI8379561.1 BRCA1-associated protein 2-domain-containing protein [Radiomyces spectabilis]